MLHSTYRLLLFFCTSSPRHTSPFFVIHPCSLHPLAPSAFIKFRSSEHPQPTNPPFAILTLPLLLLSLYFVLSACNIEHYIWKGPALLLTPAVSACGSMEKYKSYTNDRIAAADRQARETERVSAPAQLSGGGPHSAIAEGGGAKASLPESSRRSEGCRRGRTQGCKHPPAAKSASSALRIPNLVKRFPDQMHDRLLGLP